MTNQHPITPPPELVQEWRNAAPSFGLNREKSIATQAARWGADQELQACINWLHENDWKAVYKHLRAARRPKPPSLKEQAHEALGRFFSNAHTQASEMSQDFEIIRRAVEALPND